MEIESQMRAFCSFMQKVFEAIGIAVFTPSPSGLVSMKVDDDYVINVQYIPATGKMMVFLPFLNVGKAPASLFRELLTANLFGSETGGGWFGLEKESECLVYHYMVDFGLTDEPDVDDFIRTLEKILELVEIWRVHLTEDHEDESLASASSMDEILSGIRLEDQIRP